MQGIILIFLRHHLHFDITAAFPRLGPNPRPIPMTAEYNSYYQPFMFGVDPNRSINLFRKCVRPLS